MTITFHVLHPYDARESIGAKQIQLDVDVKLVAFSEFWQMTKASLALLMRRVTSSSLCRYKLINTIDALSISGSHVLEEGNQTRVCNELN